MTNSRPMTWYGSPLIRAIGTALLFFSFVSVPIVTSAQNLGKQPATGKPYRASKPASLKAPS